MNNRIVAVLSNKQFLYLWLAEIFSQIAMNMVNFVLIIVVFKLSNSNTAVSGIVLSFTIPAILFGLLAGIYVDRWNKKKVLFLTNVLRAILLFGLVAIHTNLAFVYFLTFSIAIVTQFFIPAETPVVPMLVKKSQLLTANALFGMGIYGSVFVAYALSGPLLLFFGETVVFMILSVLFFIAAIFVVLIKVPVIESGEEEEADASIAQDVRSAFSLMVKTKDISQSLFLLTLSQLIILIMGVIGPGYAKQILDIQVDAFPLLFVTPAALGMVIGAIIIGNYFHKYSRSKCATVGVLLAGISMVLLPYGSHVASRDFVQSLNAILPHMLRIDILHIMTLLAFVLGFANALVFVPSNTLLQEKTSESFRGKVYGGLNALVGVFSLLPIILVGGLADILGVGRVLTGIGVVIISIGAVRVGLSLRK